MKLDIDEDFPVIEKRLIDKIPYRDRVILAVFIVLVFVEIFILFWLWNGARSCGM